jgi:hypothetical protein
MIAQFPFYIIGSLLEEKYKSPALHRTDTPACRLLYIREDDRANAGEHRARAAAGGLNQFPHLKRGIHE